LNEVDGLGLQITILGSNAAVAAHGRFPSGQLLKGGNDICLIDCGEGTQFRLQQYKLPSGRIRYIFISHLHGDHIFGLPSLITTWHLTGRVLPLDIWSPPGLEELMSGIFRFTGCTPAFPIRYHAIPEGSSDELLESTTLRVRAFPLKHRLPTSGFRFFLLNKEVPLSGQRNVTNFNKHSQLGCSYAYCSDTSYNPEVVAYLKDVDLLYHEATFLEEQSDKASKTGHSTAREAASIAALVHAKGLVLGHFSARYKDLGLFLNEASTVFNPCFLAKEGVTFHVT